MKIRCYGSKTIKTYKNALVAFLRWFGGPPHRVTREHVREFLEMLVDSGKGSSWLSLHLSVIRTVFDKMCGRAVTLGLQTPRRPKRIPVVLSVQEITRLLMATVSLRGRTARHPCRDAFGVVPTSVRMVYSTTVPCVSLKPPSASGIQTRWAIRRSVGCAQDACGPASIVVEWEG